MSYYGRNRRYRAVDLPTQKRLDLAAEENMRLKRLEQAEALEADNRRRKEALGKLDLWP